MNYFKYIKPFIFSFNEESAHRLAIWSLKHNLLPKTNTSSCSNAILGQRIWDMDFKNPIGLAAGFDKNAQCIKALSQQGFGFIETGTVTPLPQYGNPKPRIFRCEADKAIINRLGFNNKGATKYIEQLRSKEPSSTIIGANIGKNKATKDPAQDYIKLLNEVYGLSDYITINISSPNTPNLRDLQKNEALDSLLEAIEKTKDNLRKASGHNIPILLKITPDIDKPEVKNIVNCALSHNIDGIIISNTTIARDNLSNPEFADQTGGLSGKPLFEKSNEILKEAYRFTRKKIPLIGVGGIFTGADAYAKIRSGASLVQIYTCLIYEGFDAVNAINKQLSELLKQDGFSNISDAIGVDVK